MDKFKEIFQKFGGAMLVPVLMFVFFGSAVGLTICVTSFAEPGSAIYNFFFVLQEGAWTAFRQMPLLFVIGLPISLAKKAHARACLEAFVIYCLFNYFIAAFLTTYPVFGVDMTQDVGGMSGLASIASIKTLDTSIIGALVISGISTYIHNKFFDVKLPDAISIFQGTVLIVMIGFFVMIPVSLVTCIIWPTIQEGIASLQSIMVSSGWFGVWIYTFLERILIPTGLHHFIYQPFVFGPAVVDGGIATYFPLHMQEFMDSSKTLAELFPAGAFSLHGSSKIFAPLGISAAFYATAKPEKRQKTLSILIPAALTAIVAGITEPFEFTFLFVSPILFGVHALLAATLATVTYLIGCTGNFGGGLIEFLTLNWIPLGAYHWQTYLAQIGIGLAFSVIYFVVFRFMILKFNFATPGREEDEDVKLYTKKDYQARSSDNNNAGLNSFQARATAFLDLVGGAENVESVANCATRLRLKLTNNDLLPPAATFNDVGAHGLVITKNQVQIIVGLDVPQVREEFEKLIALSGKSITSE